MGVKIISDSVCDMKQEMADELGITILPLKTLIDGEEYLDNVTITPEEFYEKLKNSKELPKTTQLTPADYFKAIKPIVEEGDEAVIITLGSMFSGTNQNAHLAAEEFKDKVFVVDSESATISQQILVKLAAQLRDKGLSAKEIADELERQKKRIHLVACVDTLEYLKRGGRISKTLALAGTMFKVKPILDLNMGEVKITAKPRGHKKGYQKATETIKALGNIDFEMPVIIGYSGTDPAPLDNYLKTIPEEWKEILPQMPRTDIGSTMSTHAGPGCYGVAFFSKEEDQ